MKHAMPTLVISTLLLVSGRSKTVGNRCWENKKEVDCPDGFEITYDIPTGSRTESKKELLWNYTVYVPKAFLKKSNYVVQHGNGSWQMNVASAFPTLKTIGS